MEQDKVTKENAGCRGASLEQVCLPAGLSLVVSCGRFGGFYVSCGERWLGVCLGWVSVRAFTVDIDAAMANLLNIAWQWWNRRDDWPENVEKPAGVE